MIFIPYGTVEKSPRHRFPWVTVLLALANVAVFAVEIYLLFTYGDAALDRFIQQYAFIPASLRDGLVPLGLLSAMFLHAGLVHIIGNLLYFLPFGDNVEDRLGHGRFLLFYLLCGIVATLTYGLFNLGSYTPLIGASGAIGGVLGGYLALHPRGSQVKGLLFLFVVLFPIRLPAILFIGYWFVIQVFSSITALDAETVAGQGGGVAFLAHVGGFVAGLILAPLMARRVPEDQPKPAGPFL